MKTIALVFLFVFVIVNTNLAQVNKKYGKFATKAYTSIAQKDYLKAAKYFSKAIQSNDGKAYPVDRHNAACVFALSGQIDSAFYHLNYIVFSSNLYKRIDQIPIDKDFTILHGDIRWKTLIKEVERKLVLMIKDEKKSKKELNLEFMTYLENILDEDQSIRGEWNLMEETFAWDSEEMETFHIKLNRVDSLNKVKITTFLDTHGWLGPDSVGYKASSALFFVIQHAELEMQEKYLPMMRQAVKDGNANASHLAMLEDRIALDKGERQIYGSQIYMSQKTGKSFVMPVKDPDHIDDRRAEVGLGSMAEYAKYFDLKWNPKKHKRNTEKYEEILAKTKDE